MEERTASFAASSEVMIIQSIVSWSAYCAAFILGQSNHVYCSVLRQLLIKYCNLYINFNNALLMLTHELSVWYIQQMIRYFYSNHVLFLPSGCSEES